MAQDITLAWGSLQFAGSSPSSTSYVIEAMADGTNFDNPEPLLEVVKSLLSDGSLAVLQGWDNRDVVIRLKLSAADGQPAGRALAAAEAALMAEVLADSKSPLVYVPAADEAPTCVFDVVAARLDRDTSDGWDYEEVKRADRFYVLTLTCLPFARPELPVSVAALAPPPATETHFQVDDGTSTTGWSVTSSGVGTVTRRNLVTNPSFESSTTGWSQYSKGGAVVRSTTRASVGAASGLVSTNVSGTGAVVGTVMPVTAGATYAAQARFWKVAAETENSAFFFAWYASTDGSGAALSSSSVTAALAAGSWVSQSTTVTAPADANSVRLGVGFTWTGSKIVQNAGHIDAVMFEQSASVGTYFDGSTATAGSTQYAWTGTPGASISVAYTVPSRTVVSGAIDTKGTVVTSPTASLALTRTGSVSMTSTPYLRISAAWSSPYGQSAAKFTVTSGGVTRAVDPVAITTSTFSGYFDFYLQVGDFDAVTMSVEVSNSVKGSSIELWITHIERTDKITGAGSTTRQQSRSATVAGSAPTQAAIHLYDATPAALGTDILVYTSRNTGRSPALRSLMTSSAAVTADTSMVSGSRNTLGSAMVFRLPASTLTEGTYALMGRLNVTTAGTLSWQARMVSSTGATTVGSTRVVSGSTALAVTSGYQVSVLGSIALPVVAVEADQMVELTLTGTADMTIDEAWLFGLDDGALTWVKDTDSLTWIEIRSPELGATRPSVYGGTGANGNASVCIDWKCGSFGAHRFDPGLMQVFTVTTASLVSQSTLEFYPRYHSHVEDYAA